MSLIYNGENAMLIGAEQAWEDLNRPCPWDEATKEDYLTFAWESDLPGRIIGDAISAKSFDDDSAWYLYENLPEEMQAQLAEAYISNHGLQQRFANWLRCYPA